MLPESLLKEVTQEYLCCFYFSFPSFPFLPRLTKEPGIPVITMGTQSGKTDTLSCSNFQGKLFKVLPLSLRFAVVLQFYLFNLFWRWN
jgi:hypothetical protein